MTTEERLEKLERGLARAKRRNRWLVAAVGVTVAVSTLAWTWNKTTAKVIRPNQFVLEDENGNRRAELSVDKDGPALFLHDQNGKPRATLGVAKDGAVMRQGSRLRRFFPLALLRP